jgi:hypothetical protein
MRAVAAIRRKALDARRTPHSLRETAGRKYPCFGKQDGARLDGLYALDFRDLLFENALDAVRQSEL